MEVVKKNNYDNQFPMKIICKRVVDRYGFAYGDEKDFCGSILEVGAKDIKKHSWFKYPNYEGTDYGVICPICKKFIALDESTINSSVLKSAEEVSVS